MKATNLTWQKADMDWIESDLHSSMKEGDANLSATQSRPHLSESVMRGQKNVIKIGLHSEHQDTDHVHF